MVRNPLVCVGLQLAGPDIWDTSGSIECQLTWETLGEEQTGKSILRHGGGGASDAVLLQGSRILWTREEDE